MMKRFLSALLVASLLCSMFVMSVVAESNSMISIPASQLEKKFVVDGNLDIWYLNENDATADGDGNYYQYVALSPTEKSDGVSYYSDPVTFAQAWTAWDDNYVYIYMKVWDDELVAWDPDGKHAGGNSSAADSLEIWFDPDPNSQTHTYTYDADGKIIAETPKAKEDIKDNFCNQTSDEAQGDVQVRLLAANMQRHDYHNKVKPNYGGVTFGEWVANPQNFCTFTFENEPITVEETGTEVSSGYGVEARFPRHDDSSNHYRFHLCANNSADEVWEHYALATGNAWWMSYDTAWSVTYIKDAPFFTQSDEQLASKGVVYTDSEINKAGAGGALVNKIAALGTVTAADLAKVEALMNEYKGLTVLEQGYVQYKNYAVLEEAWKTVNGGEIPEDPDQEAADKVIAMIDALTAGDAEAIKAARAAYDALTDAQKGKVTNLAKLEELEAGLVGPAVKYGDVNGDGKDDAADALEVLKSVVGKVKLTDAQLLAGDVNGDKAVNAQDALLILQKVVGKLPAYPVEI